MRTAFWPLVEVASIVAIASGLWQIAPSLGMISVGVFGLGMSAREARRP
jgi:hypothetical protein